MEDLLSTPVVRTGPTSRLLRRQSSIPDPNQRQSALPAPRTPKEANLERSLHMLDKALESPLQKRDITTTMDVTRNIQDFTRPFNRSMNYTQFGTTMNLGNHTMSSVMMEENPGVTGTGNLFDEFLSVMSSGSQGLDTIADFEQMVGGHVASLRRVVVNLPKSKEKYPKTISVLNSLIFEMRTWRIMGKMYTDRLITCAQEPPVLPPPSPGSERHIIERFFQNNHDVRQAYMVVDWLEKNAHDQHLGVLEEEMQWFSDATICWENTTAALSRGQGGVHMVKELDPDAPHRTGLQLHDLDQQDEAKLIKCVYGLVRCGLLDDAQDLCVRLGQPWRAATLEGWKLYHDPNYESGTDGRGDKLPVEGNKHRDIWKKVAWGLTKDSSLPQYERSVYASLCGNLQQLREVSSTWEDRLWSGAKCAVDVMVETEIRSNMVKNFAELPTEYWNTPCSMSKVLKESFLGTDESDPIYIYYVIQSHLILDNYPALVNEMVHWIETKNIEDHLFRLMAHIVLINRMLGIEGSKEGEDKILREYAVFLMKEDKLGIIPWYVSRLEPEVQVPLYSRYLSGVREIEDQALCLYLGREIGLDMKSIVVAAVSSVRSNPSADNDAMVASLGWLGHDQSQAADLLYQANAVIRRLLALGQIELATQAASKIPRETMSRVLKVWREEGGGDELPGGSVREHLALKVYLDAQESFSDWFDHFHRGQPKRPVTPENPTFTEKVAHEQRQKQYAAELERWRGGQIIQSRQAEEKLREVLNFPGGWLTELQEDEDEEMMMNDEEQQRREEINKLRAEFLPQTLLLLHSVLHNTGQYQACIKLANVIVDEHTRNYVAFSKEKINQILSKIRESSLAVMEEGKDPWGFPKP